MTRRPGRSAANDPGLAALIGAKRAAVCMVGKTWDFHVDVALDIPRDENMAMIARERGAGRERGAKRMFDAEHFFDGYKANPDYAFECLQAADEPARAGSCSATPMAARLPHEVERIVGDGGGADSRQQARHPYP